MDGANADSDHSMTWEDFFGSTTDLTPTLIGIYDSLLEPEKNKPAGVSRFDLTAKDARNDPPLDKHPTRIEETKDKAKLTSVPFSTSPPKIPIKISAINKMSGIATVNKSSLYTLRTKVDSEKNGACDSGKSDLTSSDCIMQRTFKNEFKTDVTPTNTFDNLSPNVKRMISSATDANTNPLKFQKKSTLGRSSGRGHRSNIPLVGATSKIAQSRVEVSSTVGIYDQPCGMKTFNKSKSEEHRPSPVESPSKIQRLKPDFKLDVQETYDVPTNNRPAIYDVPTTKKNAFESLSLPYIDQSIELSISANDREFDTKVSSKDNTPDKPQTSTPERSPLKIPKAVTNTNSLNRKDFNSKPESPAKQLSKTGPYPEVIGSTGNLKTCQEKEVPRLNPPSVEVTRPLSMSSIASSSSTSSSGVQNKGGVNSAYLASIESLDDHSDADLTSANGSNNFVNNAGVMNKSVSEERHSESLPRDVPEELSGLSQLERVCSEIVHTENVYVQDLQQVVEGYLHEWRREVTFSEEELQELFNNIEDIYNFNRSLCEELNSCRLDATCIARCFVNNTSGFSVYTSYCTGYPRTMERLAALASKSHSAREFRERQLALGHPLPLASYLLKPVQRILKYHLLLQNVVKQCVSPETQYALLKMTGIAQHIDDMKRRHEHAVRVQEIQSLLYGWNGPDLTTYGELCAEGTFRVFGAKAMRHAFLFDKMLLITKNREDGILAYKSHIMCNNMMLVESIAGAPLSFHVIPWDAPRGQLTLQARSPRHKREWTLLLKRVILENYNAVIPSHARQLVMELGQNKTDDDMLAEKSHNLITQASMRKQLSAPEYLEKRKVERERRKSFENGLGGRLKKVNRKYTVPVTRSEVAENCDCVQVSTEKGIDYTCDNCYIDLCSDCEAELSHTVKGKDDECSCRHEDNNDSAAEKCAECDRTLHFIDAGSAENMERKPVACKCSDFKSSHESFAKEFPSSLNKTRGYHSSDNIVGYTDTIKSKEDLSDTNNSMTNVRNIPKTCLKCAKIKENIVVTDSNSTIHSRRSRCSDIERFKTDTLRSKSKDDPQRSKLSKIGTWRRKSEPGLQQNTIGIIAKKSQDSESDKAETKGSEKIEFECRNCGSNKINKKNKTNTGVIISDPELNNRKRGFIIKPNIEITKYNTKNVPKKISKLKKNRAKGIRIGPDTTAKFYAELSTDVSTENILHISESNDSLNIDKKETNEVNTTTLQIPKIICKDDDIDEETYKKLIEKTDSFKKNELEKVKFLNKQKVINEGSEVEGEKTNEVEIRENTENVESCEESEQPLEHIISQLLMQNREFQKLLKKQQQRNTAQRRHQRLLKSHSNPEQGITSRTSESGKLKPKYGRQTSETIISNDDELPKPLSPPQEVDDALEDEDHIYETLRVESKVDENLHSLNDKSKSVQYNTRILRPKRLPSPPNPDQNTEAHLRGGTLESDYVYLSFDKLNQIQDEGIYDVPVKSPQKVQEQPKDQTDYYVIIEKVPLLPAKETNVEELYDSIVEVCRRKKEPVTITPGEYLPMSPEQQSPNAPEIWLSRQKEHFNVSRDRKSGSLPRSFQIVTGNEEENNLSSFKCKPNSNSKTYLNRDGKVISSDRPFTIASDQSEISYDDVENYMSDGDILKFNKSSNLKGTDTEHMQNISQSTLELEEEIDRCYKNNFLPLDLDSNKNEDILNTSQQNLNVSMTSSCEVLSTDRNEISKSKDVEVIHPDHKIYKPTTNMLSLKNVLSRFKNRKINDDSEVNANDQSSPESGKSDPKSPTSEKRSALNPRNYSKNLLQRFRSIIGDDQPDDNHNRSESPVRTKKTDDVQNLLKSDIKVVITSTDASHTSSPVVCSSNNDALSRSVCENTTLSESQNEMHNLETLSHSCDNLPKNRPSYEKSVSLVTNISSTAGSAISSPVRSVNSSYQSLNKLPIYMQGSKNLGARIAQSDYVDPMTLMDEKAALKSSINVLINRNSVRPDSLFSNSSFVTSSSEGTYHEKSTTEVKETKAGNEKPSSSSTLPANSDDSYYEKSFEKIEQVVDEEMFRDSAVYSDQEDVEENKAENIDKNKNANKIVTRVDSVKRTSLVKTQKVTVTSTVNEIKTNIQTRVTVTTSKAQELEKAATNTENKVNEKVKPKIAPPVPAKPKITNIPTATSFQRNIALNRSNNLIKAKEQSSSNESINNNMKTIKRNTTLRQSLKSEPAIVAKNKATATEKQGNHTVKAPENDKPNGIIEEKPNKEEIKHPPTNSNIQMKRLSFERASLDSATRKTKPTIETKRSSVEPQKGTMKSVLERRMEIESLTKTVNKPVPLVTKKPSHIAKPKSLSTKVAPFERSISDFGKSVKDKSPTNIERDNIPSTEKSITDQSKLDDDVDAKGSWVKTVVNKFQ